LSKWQRVPFRMWKTRTGHLYTVVGPSVWPAHIGENGPPDRQTGYARQPGLVDWDDRRRPWAGFHPVRHRFEGTSLASLSLPGCSETVLERDTAGYYRPKHAAHWKLLGANLHALSVILLREFAPGEGWIPPPYSADSPLLQWHLERNNTLKAARLERLRLMEMCCIISMCSAIGWLTTSNPDAWIDTALDPKRQPDATFVTFVNSLKHTFIVDSNIPRVGVFVKPAAVSFGVFLPVFARAGVPLVLSWGLESQITACLHNVPACWHPTPSLIVSAQDIGCPSLSAGPSNAPRPPVLATSVFQVEDSLDAANAIARHVRNFNSRSETPREYWARRLNG
jgi:hypothetical protein